MSPTDQSPPGQRPPAGRPPKKRSPEERPSEKRPAEKHLDDKHLDGKHLDEVADLRPLRVAVVDDSMFIRKAITRMLEDDPQIEVVGSAGSGEELLTHLDQWRPDAVTLDLDMPGMGGLETLDRLRVLRPTPVIILSTHSGKGAPSTIEALHRGATDFIDKQCYSLVDFDALRSILLEKLFEVTNRAPMVVPEISPPLEKSLSEPVPVVQTGFFDLVVLGASTGGPPTLQTILEEIGDRSCVPIVIVQHMPKGFTGAFAERLNAYLPLKVCEARHRETLEPGTVYIAAAGSHLRFRRDDTELVTEVSRHPKGLVHVPSIDVLFESAARTCGRRVAAALLTGMGSDGAKGMAALRARGAHTFAQDEASCVVFGMPRAAELLGAVVETANPVTIGRRLRELACAPKGLDL